MNTAKALMVSDGHKTNSHSAIIQGFDSHYVQNGVITLEGSFTDLVNRMNQQSPTEEFAREYLKSAQDFYKKIDAFRAEEVAHA